MNVNKIQTVLIAIIIGLAGYIAYDHMQSTDGNSQDDAVQTEDIGSDSDSGTMVSSTISDAITVNNADWGYVQILSYVGSSVTYQAVPHEGCGFVAWIDSNGRYIERSDRITNDQLDPKGTVAEFIDQVPDESKVISYGWQMPTFTYDSNGKMKYTNMTYNAEISEDDYIAYRDASVHREAVLGNVYLTPWELVADDPAVEDMVEYLEPLVQDLTNMKTAWVVMSFVQDIITYQTDSAQYGSAEYWAYPIETVYSGKGDCEDTAVLFCAVGSKLGLDTGLVSFSYSDVARKNLGHMGAAFALQGNEGVSAENNPIFTYANTRYCYIETATDSRLDLGYLLKYPDVSAYLIEDGGFTHITYSEEDGFGHDVLVSIGTSYNTGRPVIFGEEVAADVIYGDDFTNPPTITMNIGDSFSYIPATNLPCTFTVHGDGLVSEGGPFTFNPETNELSGKAMNGGTYHVIIKAETIAPEPYQVAYQYITFDVGYSELPNYGGFAKTLSFVNGSWNMASVSNPDVQPVDTTDTLEGSDSHEEFMNIMKTILVGVAIAALGLFIITRF